MVFTLERDGDLYEQIKEELESTKLRNRGICLKRILKDGLAARGDQAKKSVMSALKLATYTMAKNESNKPQDKNRKAAALLVLIAAHLDSQ